MKALHLIKLKKRWDAKYIIEQRKENQRHVNELIKNILEEVKTSFICSDIDTKSSSFTITIPISRFSKDLIDENSTIEKRLAKLGYMYFIEKVNTPIEMFEVGFSEVHERSKLRKFFRMKPKTCYYFYKMYVTFPV